MAEDFETEEPKYAVELKKIKGYQQIEVMLKKYFTISLCFRTKMWLVHIMGKSVAVGFIYLCYLQYKAKQSNILEVDFRWFCEKIMPNGIVKPSELSHLILTAEVCFKDKKYLTSINYTIDDLKDYADAKQEAKGFGDDFKKSINSHEIKPPKCKKFSATELMNNPRFLKNINKNK